MLNACARIRSQMGGGPDPSFRGVYSMLGNTFPPPPPCAHVVEHGPGVQVPEEDERLQLVLVVAVDPRPDPCGRPHGRGGVAMPPAPPPPPQVRRGGAEATSCPLPPPPPSKPMPPPIAPSLPAGTHGDAKGGVRGWGEEEFDWVAVAFGVPEAVALVLNR